MKKIIFLVLLTIVALSCRKNKFPSIDGMVAEPDSVYPGEVLTLSFTSSNHRVVDHFDWSCLVGSWVTENNLAYGTTQWIAPKITGEHYIRLSLFNGNNVTIDSIRVVVMDTVGTFIDNRDNHIYQWVKIGKQIWMAENMAYLPQVDRYSSYSTDEERFYVYGYNGNKVPDARNTVYYQLYGVLYNRPAAEAVCPEGWHLPVDDDWITLTTFLTPNAGRKMKSATGWEMDYYGNDCNGDNSSGFNALPGGSYAYDLNHGVPAGFEAGKYALFWAHNYNSIIIIQSNAYSLGPGENAMSGLSVRCIKDSD